VDGACLCEGNVSNKPLVFLTAHGTIQCVGEAVCG
jgi:hypothetical protein